MKVLIPLIPVAAFILGYYLGRARRVEGPTVRAKLRRAEQCIDGLMVQAAQYADIDNFAAITLQELVNHKKGKE